MKRCRFLLVPVLLAVLAAPALGMNIFKHAAKPNPKERVPELLIIVKTDKDEHKRAQAAEELRQYDVAAFPDIVPILIDVLMSDEKSSVRTEAAQSLGKLRPVAQQVGWALEQAQSKDASMRVRLQARASLLSYHMAGYHSPKTDAPPEVKGVAGQSAEPPIAAPATSPGIAKPATSVKPVPVAPRTTPVSSPAPPQSFPLPPVPTPATGPSLNPPPVIEQTSAPKVSGPDLTPPQ